MNGVWFGAIHSFDDLSLILSSKEIEPPTVKTNMIDIPGGDGEIDFTEFFGGVKYNNRNGKLVFSYIGAMSTFPDEFSLVQNSIHGKRFEITFDDDPDFYYIGRCHVDKTVSQKGYATIEVSINCQPYKLKKFDTTVRKTITDTGIVLLTNLKKPVVPVISTSAAVNLAWLGGSASIPMGNNQILPELVLNEGSTEITVTGATTIAFNYREGEF